MTAHTKDNDGEATLYYKRTMESTVRTKHSFDDLELMIHHEKFPEVVAAVHAVKQMHAGHYHRPNLPPTQVWQAVDRIQSQFAPDRPTICQGQYPLTDLLIQDCLETLQREQEEGPQERQQQHSHHGSTSSDSQALSLVAPKKKKKHQKAIAIKYDKWQTDILMQWMIDHKDRPFPDNEQITELMKKTNLTSSQVVNWATNVRKRNRKATLDGTKEPHHFIDFIFLAHQQYQAKIAATRETAVTPPAYWCSSSPTPPDVLLLEDEEEPPIQTFPDESITTLFEEQPSPTFSGKQVLGDINTVSPAVTEAPYCADIAETLPPPLPGADEVGWESDIDLEFDPLSFDEADDDFILKEFAEGWLDQVSTNTASIVSSVTDDSDERNAKQARLASI